MAAVVLRLGHARDVRDPLDRGQARRTDRRGPLKERYELPAAPREDPLGGGVRIDDEGDLRGAGEEVPVDEEVVLGQEDAEARMAVVPADDLLVLGELAAERSVDLLPRLLSERQRV